MMNYINRLLRKSGGVLNKSTGGGTGNEEDLKKCTSVESADKLSQGSLPSTPTRSVADTDTTPDYESADEGQTISDLTLLSQHLEKIHINTTPERFSSSSVPPEEEGHTLVKFSSPSEKSDHISSPDSSDLNITWNSVIDKTLYKSVYLNTTNLNQIDNIVTLSDSPINHVESESVLPSLVSIESTPVTFTSSKNDKVFLTPSDINYKSEDNFTSNDCIPVDLNTELTRISSSEDRKSFNELQLRHESHQPSSGVKLALNNPEVGGNISDGEEKWVNVPLDISIEEDSAETCSLPILPKEKDSFLVSNISSTVTEITPSAFDVSKRLDNSGGIADSSNSLFVVKENKQSILAENLSVISDEPYRINVNFNNGVVDLNSTESKESTSSTNSYSLIPHEVELVGKSVVPNPNCSTDCDKLTGDIQVSEERFNNTFVSGHVQGAKQADFNLVNEPNVDQVHAKIEEFVKDTNVTEIASQENKFCSEKVVEENQPKSVTNYSCTQNIVNSQIGNENAIIFNIETNNDLSVKQNFSELVSKEKLHLDKNSEIFDIKQQNEFISSESSVVGAPVSSSDNTVTEGALNLGKVEFSTSVVSQDNEHPVSPKVKFESNKNLLKDPVSCFPSFNDVSDDTETNVAEDIHLQSEFSPLNVSSASEKELQENIETCSALLLEEISDLDKSTIEPSRIPVNAALSDETTDPESHKTLNKTCEVGSEVQILLHETVTLNEENLNSYTEKLEPLTDVINKSIPELFSAGKSNSVSDTLSTSSIQVLDITDKKNEKIIESQDSSTLDETIETFHTLETGNDLLDQESSNFDEKLDVKIGRTSVHSNLHFLFKGETKLDQVGKTSAKGNESSFQSEHAKSSIVRSNNVIRPLSHPNVTSSLELIPIEIKEKVEEIIKDATDIVVSKKNELPCVKSDIEYISEEIKAEEEIVANSLSVESATSQASNVCPLDVTNSSPDSKLSLSSDDNNQVKEVNSKVFVSSSSSSESESKVCCGVSLEENDKLTTLHNKTENKNETTDQEHQKGIHEGVISSPSVREVESAVGDKLTPSKISPIPVEKLYEIDKDFQKKASNDNDELSDNLKKLSISEGKNISKSFAKVLNSSESDFYSNLKQISSETLEGDTVENEEFLRGSIKESSTILEDSSVKRDLLNCSLSTIASLGGSKTSPYSPPNLISNTSVQDQSVQDQLNRSYRDLTELIVACSKQERELAENDVKTPENFQLSEFSDNKLIITPEKLLEIENLKLKQDVICKITPLITKTELEISDKISPKTITGVQESTIEEAVDIALKPEYEAFHRKKHQEESAKTPEKFQVKFEEKTVITPSSKSENVDIKISQPSVKEEKITTDQQEDEIIENKLSGTPKKYLKTDDVSNISEQSYELGKVIKTPEKFFETLKKEEEEVTLKHESKLSEENKVFQTPEKLQDSFKENTDTNFKVELEDIEKNTFKTPDKYKVNFKEEASIISQTLMAEGFDDQDILNEHMMQPPPSADINNSEAGPITADEDFHKGEFFQEASEVDFNLTPAKLAPSLTRQSLYIRFDPLIEAALAAQSEGDQETHDNSLGYINSTRMADTKIGEGGDVEKSPKRDRNLKESQQLIMINTPGKTSDLSASEKLNNSSPSTPPNTTKRTLAGGGGTPSLRQEVSKLQDLMLEQEQAYVEQLAEKNDMVETLRKRVSELEAKEPRADLEDKLRSRELEVGKLRKELSENSVSNKQLLIIMEEYEKAIASSVRRREDEKNEFEKIKEKIAGERDSALQHLSNMEVAFNDIHLKYERCKGVIETLHTNEQQLKKTIHEQDLVIEQQKQSYATLKQHATDKVNEANQEIATAHKTYQAEIAKMKAVSKKAELRVKSLEESLEQKKKEIKELMQICDELIGKVSGQ